MAILYVDLLSGTDTSVFPGITGASKTNPCVISSVNHGFVSGDYIAIWSVGGMTQLNNTYFYVASTNPNAYQLSGINSTGYTTFTTGGIATKYGLIPSLPFKTVNTANTVTTLNNEIRIAKTPDPVTYTIPNSATWTYNSLTISTSSNMTSSFAIGDYIGKLSAAGNGSFETYYRVNNISVSSITLGQKYYGSTEVVNFIKKVPIATTGVAGAYAITISRASTIINGGWTLSGTPTQDGETWFKSNNIRTVTVGGINNTVNSSQISKLNIVETYIGCINTVSNACSMTNTNCTFLTYSTSSGNAAVNGWVNIYNSVLASTVGTCFNGSAWSNTPANNNYLEDNLFLGGAQGVVRGDCYLVKNCTFFNNTNYGVGGNFTISQAVVPAFSGINKFYYCGTGIVQSLAVSNISNCEFYNCGTGLNSYGSNTIINCIFNNCTSYGITTSTLSVGTYVRDCEFRNCGYGFYSGTRNHGHEIANSQFYSCGRGVYINTESGSMTIRNCYFELPTTLALERANTAGTYDVINCTIDPASNNKAYNIATPSFYPQKCYKLDNSFDKSGSIWGCGSKLTDKTTYRTTAPSLAISWVTQSTTNQMPMKVMSSMINSGTSATYGMYMKSTTSPAWSGTIIPQWRLNKDIIKTESTTITAISSNWLPYSWSVLAAQVTASGELALEFVPNMGTNYSINMDDFTVT